MSEMRKGKRVIFPPGEQRRFLMSVLNKEKVSYILFAEKIGVNPRTFNDWLREKYSLPLKILKKIIQHWKLKMPSNIEIREPFWYTSKGGRIGGRAVFRKYGRIEGDPEYRKQRWYEWWEKEGKFKSKIGHCKSIKEPIYSSNLAEFVGIMIGDGGITDAQVTISFNPETDKRYGAFVKNLIKTLFGVTPSVYRKKNQLLSNIVVSRKRLVNFCQSIGLKIGNKLKQNVDIPEWIKRKKHFKIACIRGLFDTDGCIFNECHHINGKNYCYPRWAFASNCELLRNSVFEILKEFGFNPRIRNNRNVQLENKEEIIKYFKFIGTNNSKHKERFKYFVGGVG